jgi:hypothetical protein
MTDEHGFRFVPVHGTPAPGAFEKSRPFNMHDLAVVGVLAICDIDESPTANTLPSMSVKITQYVHLADDSLIRLDMDRGFTSVRHGLGEYEAVSWARTASDFVAEVLDLVQPDDEENTDPHPWEELAQAARRREIDVDGAVLRGLSYQVLLTAELLAVLQV